MSRGGGEGVGVGVPIVNTGFVDNNHKKRGGGQVLKKFNIQCKHIMGENDLIM